MPFRFPLDDPEQTQQQCLFPDIMTLFLKIFHSPYCEQRHVKNIFFPHQSTCANHITLQKQVCIYTWMRGWQTKLVSVATLLRRTAGIKSHPEQDTS